MGKKGFTLIELLAVITILAIILTITIPILLKVIKDSKNTVGKDSLELYGRSIENAVASYYTKYPQKNEVTLQELKQEKLLDYKGKEITCEQVEIYERDVYLANCKAGDKLISTTYGKPIFASTNKDYSGYYADVDSDGTVDGVIYADLAHSQSGEWGVNHYATYSYDAQTGLKEYTISKEKYTKRKFGEKEIISTKKGSSGKERFYVMALDDYTTDDYTTFYWYKNAVARMPSSVKDTSEAFGKGKENTETIIDIWNAGESGKYNAAQNERDIFKYIQEKCQQGWYIPSLGEWTAFVYYFTNKTDLETKLTISNYNSAYELSDRYWSSSQSDPYKVVEVYFGAWIMSGYTADMDVSVRLGATF